VGAGSFGGDERAYIVCGSIEDGQTPVSEGAGPLVSVPKGGETRGGLIACCGRCQMAPVLRVLLSVCICGMCV